MNQVREFTNDEIADLLRKRAEAIDALILPGLLREAANRVEQKHATGLNVENLRQLECCFDFLRDRVTKAERVGHGWELTYAGGSKTARGVTLRLACLEALKP